MQLPQFPKNKIFKINGFYYRTAGEIVDNSSIIVTNLESVSGIDTKPEIKRFIKILFSFLPENSVVLKVKESGFTLNYSFNPSMAALNLDKVYLNMITRANFPPAINFEMVADYLNFSDINIDLDYDLDQINLFSESTSIINKTIPATLIQILEKNGKICLEIISPGAATKKDLRKFLPKEVLILEEKHSNHNKTNSNLKTPKIGASLIGTTEDLIKHNTSNDNFSIGSRTNPTRIASDLFYHIYMYLKAKPENDILFLKPSIKNGNYASFINYFIQKYTF